MSSSLEAPPAAASLATHPLGRDVWTLSVLLSSALGVILVYFATPTALWGAALLFNLTVAVHQVCGSFETRLAAVGMTPRLAPRLESIKLP
jgi:hypothetical protein